jgi:hypothetical protein
LGTFIWRYCFHISSARLSSLSVHDFQTIFTLYAHDVQAQLEDNATVLRSFRGLVTDLETEVPPIIPLQHPFNIPVAPLYPPCNPRVPPLQPPCNPPVKTPRNPLGAGPHRQPAPLHRGAGQPPQAPPKQRQGRVADA